jgi:hypothetical protein
MIAKRRKKCQGSRGSESAIAGIAKGNSRSRIGGARFAGAKRAFATTAFAKQMRVSITAGRGHRAKSRQPRLQDEQNVAPLPPKDACRLSASYNTKRPYRRNRDILRITRPRGNRFAIPLGKTLRHEAILSLSHGEPYYRNTPGLTGCDERPERFAKITLTGLFF